MSPSLILLVVLLGAARPAADDLTARLDSYAETVTDALSGEAWTDAQVEAAREAIAGLASSGDPRVLAVLTKDGNTLAKRLADLLEERERKALEQERAEDSLEGKTGNDRAKLEEEITKARERVAEVRALLPPLEALRDALFEGLLTATERSAEVSPEEAWEILVANFEGDVKRHYQLEQRVSDLTARLKTVREKIAAEADDDAKAKLEKREIEIASVLEIETVRRDQTGRLKGRRVETLGTLFPRLAKGTQSRAENDIRAELRPDVAWESRAIHAELLGHLGIASAVAELTQVLKRASKVARDLEKDLGPLREKYDRALKAYVGAISSGANTIPVGVDSSLRKAERELKEVSGQAFGEARVLDACVKGLGAAVAAREGRDLEAGVEELVKLVKERDPVVRPRAVEALGGVGDERARAVLRDLAVESRDVSVRLAAIDALAALEDEPTVELCTTRLLRDEEWRIRAAAMEALVRIPRKTAIPALIQSVSVEVGRLVDDAERSLASLTGRSFHGDAGLWKDWWQKNKETFEIGKVAEPGVAAADPGSKEWKEVPGGVSFYGIQTRSNRILFVMDRSGSMNEPVGKAQTGPGSVKKIDAAKAQLKAAIAGLEDGDLFNIISYSADVSRWQKKMVEMSKRAQSKVTRHVDKEIVANGGTNIHDALAEAFRLAGIGAMDRAYESNVDTIFFLTDGRPSVGEVQDPREILRRVKEWNRLARIVVHTVGVGVDHDAAFLRRLAEENGGQYTSR